MGVDDAREQLLASASALGDEMGATTEALPSPWRWWVLATYTLVAGLQGATWGVPGVIEPSFEKVYGMSADTGA